MLPISQSFNKPLPRLSQASVCKRGGWRLRSKAPSVMLRSCDPLNAHPALATRGNLEQKKAWSLPSRHVHTGHKGGRKEPCCGFAGPGVGRWARGRVPLYCHTRRWASGRRWGGVGYAPELCALCARTYRDSEGSGPAIVQHRAVVWVLQGILN